MDKFFSLNEEDFKIIYSHTLKPEQKNFTMHMHEFLELYYFVSGKGTYVVEGTEYKLETGDIILLNQGEGHYFRIDEDVPYTRLTIQFKKDLFSRFDSEEYLLAPFQNRENGTQNLYRNYDFDSSHHHFLMNHLLSNTENKKLQTISYLLPLLYEIAEVFENRDDTPDTNSFAQGIVRYINSNYLDEINLDLLCEKFSISKTHLCRVFKNATGATINNYMTAKKLIHANNLMNMGYPPTQAASMSGFNDYTVFYKAYKKRYDVSPSVAKKV